MSNKKMVSVPEGFMLVERSIWTEQQVDSAAACITQLKDVPGMTDRDLAMAAIDAAQCKAPDITLADFLPAEQHQSEPVALPGRKDPTQHWAEPGGPYKAYGWNDCLDELAKLGPLYTRPAQGEPVAYVITPPGCAAALVHAVDLTYRSEHAVPLYTHADPAEVKRLRAVIEQQKSLIESLRAELVESHSIDASAEPCAPELTNDLREILGRPNFTCHFIAKALRVMGHSIANKSEDEQAVVIHWLLGIYLTHGPDWRQRAAAELEEASQSLST